MTTKFERRFVLNHSRAVRHLSKREFERSLTTVPEKDVTVLRWMRAMPDADFEAYEAEIQRGELDSDDDFIRQLRELRAMPRRDFEGLLREVYPPDSTELLRAVRRLTETQFSEMVATMRGPLRQ